MVQFYAAELQAEKIMNPPTRTAFLQLEKKNRGGIVETRRDKVQKKGNVM